MKNLRLRDIKKGDRFYENEFGCSVECEALEDAVRIEDEERGYYGHQLRVRFEGKEDTFHPFGGINDYA